jgi:hypothetical protein
MQTRFLRDPAKPAREATPGMDAEMYADIDRCPDDCFDPAAIRPIRGEWPDDFLT